MRSHKGSRKFLKVLSLELTPGGCLWMYRSCAEIYHLQMIPVALVQLFMQRHRRIWRGKMLRSLSLLFKIFFPQCLFFTHCILKIRVCYKHFLWLLKKLHSGSRCANRSTSIQSSNGGKGLCKMVSKSWKECLKSYTQTLLGTIK